MFSKAMQEFVALSVIKMLSGKSRMEGINEVQVYDIAIFLLFFFVHSALSLFLCLHWSRNFSWMLSLSVPHPVCLFCTQYSLQSTIVHCMKICGTGMVVLLIENAMLSACLRSTFSVIVQCDEIVLSSFYITISDFVMQVLKNASSKAEEKVISNRATHLRKDAEYSKYCAI